MKNFDSLGYLSGPICVVALYNILNFQTLCTQPLGLLTNEVLLPFIHICCHPPSNEEQPRIRINFQTHWGSVCICNIWPLSTQRLCSFVPALHHGRERRARGIKNGGREEDKKEKKYGCFSSNTWPPPPLGSQMKIICSLQQNGGWLTLKPPPTLSRWLGKRKGGRAVGRDPTGLSFWVELRLKLLVCAYETAWHSSQLWFILLVGVILRLESFHRRWLAVPEGHSCC